MINNLQTIFRTTIPMVFDDSRTVIEFLGNVVKSINEVIALVNEKLPDDFETKFYDTFRDYTAEEMDRIVASGQFQTILESIISTAQAVQTEVIAARDGKSSLSDRLNTLNDLFYDFKTEKFRYNNETDYYITEIPYAFKPKIGIANNEIGTRQSTIDFAMDAKASLAINGGISGEEYPYTRGIIIQDGII